MILGTTTLLLSAVAPAGAQLYKWRDQQTGRTHYSDSPPRQRQEIQNLENGGDGAVNFVSGNGNTGMIGKWKLVDINGDTRLPGFLQDHGYVFHVGGKWRALTRMKLGSHEQYPRGRYRRSGKRIRFFDGNIKQATHYSIQGDTLTFNPDPTIKRKDQPVITHYRKIR
jgi:hypothetical protein